MTYQEYEKLVSDYMKQHKKAENPQNWEYVLGFQLVGEFILNSNGREIEFVLPDKIEQEDGGYLKYKN